jgi:glycosyltransferase involved in cell wall biosynthesis
MLSIIIPCLNEEKYLPRLLESINSQDYRDFEIIVSNGDSKDGTQKIAKDYNCKVVVSDKRSPAHQRNYGASEAKGDILLFLDADTLLPERFLSKAIKEFKAKKLNVAGFYVQFASDKFSYKIIAAFLNPFFFLSQFVKPLSIGAAILVEKFYHQKINGFDENIFIGEDHDYSQRIAKIGKFRMISEKIYYAPRRFERKGKLKTFFEWIYCAIYALLKGSIRKQIVKYEFGEH